MVAWGPTSGAETAAQRYARDVATRGGDVKYTYTSANGGTNNVVAKTTVATDAAGGRNDREYDKRGGDVGYTYDVNGQPVKAVNDNGRNEREYVNKANGTSALAAVYGT